MEIAKVLVLSTGHVDEDTARLMPDCVPGLIAYDKGEYGWLVFTNIKTGTLPESLRACIAKGKEYGCDWVMFDRDGPTEPCLPSFDW